MATYKYTPAMRKWRFQMRELRRQLGLCTACGKVDAVEGGKRCAECREDGRAYCGKHRAAQRLACA